MFQPASINAAIFPCRKLRDGLRYLRISNGGSLYPGIIHRTEFCAFGFFLEFLAITLVESVIVAITRQSPPSNFVCLVQPEKLRSRDLILVFYRYFINPERDTKRKQLSA